MNSHKKVYVALSGGVDSSVSAALLKQEGYAVTGVFMKNWSGDDFGIQSECPWEVDQKDAELVCKKLGIPFRSYNFERQYRDKVIAYFVEELENGRTPNPDVMCNKEIKFKLFLEKALADGADMIATGHYVRRIFNQISKEFELHKAVDGSKDQSYFLYNITQEQLSKSHFPVGHLLKSEVRKLALEFDLPVAKKPDSQGICFVGEINVKEFIKAQLPEKKGEIIDIDTKKIIGSHHGVQFYTIGQREGIGIGGAGEPYYVVSKDQLTNTLTVAKGKNNPALFRNDVAFAPVHKINSYPGKKISAAIRYRQEPGEGEFTGTNKFSFKEPQRAVSSGQSIVFYEHTRVSGGAVIN
jgi:tRNA-specific 2-thiouridylase